jgi:hypothetical protein
LSHGSPTAALMHQWITHESLSHKERVQTVPSACGGPASNGQSVRPLGSFDVHRVRTIRRSVRSYSSARDSDSRLTVNGPDGRLHSGRTSLTPPYGPTSSIPAQIPTAKPPPPDLGAARGTGRRTAPPGFDRRRCRDGCNPDVASPCARRKGAHALGRAPDRRVSTRDDVGLAAIRSTFGDECLRFASSRSPSTSTVGSRRACSVNVASPLVTGASHQMRRGKSIARWCWLGDTLD